MKIKKLHTFQVSIVALFLVAFSSVFVCDFLCDLGIIEISLNSYQHEESADHGDLFAKHHHGEDAGHNKIHQHQMEIPNDQSSHNHQANQHTGGDHPHDLMTSGHHHTDQQQDTDQDDCCEEETNALFDSLIKHRTEAFNLNTNYFQLAIITFRLEKIVSFPKVDSIGELYFWDLPPPSSWDIRIFIQSFLN